MRVLMLILETRGSTIPLIRARRQWRSRQLGRRRRPRLRKSQSGGGRRIRRRRTQMVVVRRMPADGRDTARRRRRVHHGVMVVAAAVSVVRGRGRSRRSAATGGCIVIGRSRRCGRSSGCRGRGRGGGRIFVATSDVMDDVGVMILVRRV